MKVEVDAGTLLPTYAWGVTWSEKDWYAVLLPQTQEIPPRPPHGVVTLSSFTAET